MLSLQVILLYNFSVQLSRSFWTANGWRTEVNLKRRCSNMVPAVRHRVLWIYDCFLPAFVLHKANITVTGSVAYPRVYSTPNWSWDDFLGLQFTIHCGWWWSKEQKLVAFCGVSTMCHQHLGSFNISPDCIYPQQRQKGFMGGPSWGITFTGMAQKLTSFLLIIYIWRHYCHIEVILAIRNEDVISFKPPELSSLRLD